MPDNDNGSGSDDTAKKPAHASEVDKDDPHKVEKLAKMGRDEDSDAGSE